VENWFSRLKVHILKKRKVMPSELVAPLYKRLLAKYVKFYCNNDTDKTKVEKSILEKVEVWKKKKDLKRLKGFYYNNISSLARYNDDDGKKTDNVSVDDDFNDCFKRNSLDQGKALMRRLKSDFNFCCIFRKK
jgi:hypothetical protein